MISHIFHRQTGLLIRQLSTALTLTLSIFLCADAGTARAATLVDDFSSTINTVPFPFRQVQQTGVGSNSGAPPVETGLTGVIGGSRQTTVGVTAGVATARARIFAGSPGSLQYTSSGVSSNLTLNYNNNGAGLGANINPFLGVSIPFGNVALGGAPSLPVTATITDAAANVATAVVAITTEGAQTLIIPAGAFAGLGALDLSNVSSIQFMFDAGLGQEFTLRGPIQLLTPEPLAILGWSVVLMIGLAGWRYLGPRLRAA